MGPHRYLLGIDVSTTGSKALIVDDRASVVATGSSPHTLQTPRPLWSEQDPTEWWDAVARGVREALDRAGADSREIVAVGLTGQMHGLVILDEAGSVLRPAILWNDQRTAAQCEQIHRRIGRTRYLQTCGTVALTGFTAPKILWVREHEPGAFARIRHVLLPKDYVRYRLTGTYAMDKADGSGTALFDLARRDWSEELLAALDMPRQWLPPTFEGPEVTGTITEEAAARTGLRVGTPVVAGGGDQAAQAVGVGAITPGVVALTVGTSGVVFATTAAPLVEPEGRLHAFCHAVPGRWHLMGVMLSAAGSLQWYRDALAPEVGFEALLDEAAQAPPGCEGLLFLPYLSGERTPHADPLARGAFVGLTRRHGRAHMTRAVLEGVAFGLKDAFDLLQATGSDPARQVRASGGGTRSALWRQILADVLDTELVTVATTEGAALGAALLAGVGAGIWPDALAACEQGVALTGSVRPDDSRRTRYDELARIYRQVYPALTPSFAALAEPRAAR